MARLRRALIANSAALGILMIGSGVVAPDPPAPSPLVLRFVTFNLLHGGIFSELHGDDEALEERLQIVIEGLRALDADVVGLQEASTGRRRGDVAARLAAALGYRYVQTSAAYRPMGSNRMRRGVQAVLGFTEGPAILSRYPITRWEAHELPRCGHPFDVRVLLLAELETPAGRLAAFSAHTSGNACQTHAVAALVGARAGALPAVVMGDFNAADTSTSIRILTHEAGWVDTFRHANPTAPGFTEGQDVEAGWPTAARRIDYVLLVPGVRIPGRVVASRVVLREPLGRGPVRWPSDHYGVLTDIALDGDVRSPLAGGGPARDSGRLLGIRG